MFVNGVGQAVEDNRLEVFSLEDLSETGPSLLGVDGGSDGGGRGNSVV